RCADILRAWERLSVDPLDALLAREFPRPVHSQPAWARGYDLEGKREHREHFVWCGDRPRPRSIRQRSTLARRRHLLWRREGGARAVHTGTGRRSVSVRHLGLLRVTLAGRADAGHSTPPPRARSGRSFGRA